MITALYFVGIVVAFLFLRYVRTRPEYKNYFGSKTAEYVFYVAFWPFGLLLVLTGMVEEFAVLVGRGFARAYRKFFG